MSFISNLLIPLFVLVITVHGIYKKINIYEVFIDGAKESFEIVLSLFPTLLAMILGINIFIKSGVLNVLFNWLHPIFNFFKIPIEIIPLALMRPISGSTSLAILNNLLQTYGPDSFIGRLGSVIQGSTDTTFYIITVYFGAIGIKKIKHSLWAGLFADLIGITMSIILVKFIFGY